MTVLNIFVALVVALAAKDGALSCSLRGHFTPISSHITTPATTFEQHSGKINKIPSISSDSYSYPQQIPGPAPPITPISISSVNKQILLYLLRKHYNMSLDSTPIITPAPIPLYPQQSNLFYDYTVPDFQLIQTSYQTADDHSLDRITQLPSLLLSAGSGSSLLSAPASISAPSSVPKPEMAPMATSNTIVPAKSPVAVQNAIVTTKAPVAIPTSIIPVTAPTAVPSALLAAVPSTIQAKLPTDVPAMAPIVQKEDSPEKPVTNSYDSFTVSYPNVEQSSSSALAEPDANVASNIISPSTTIASSTSLLPELSTPSSSSNSIVV